MNKKSILWGIVLVLAGVYLLISQMGLVPQLPFFTVVFTVLFVYTAVQGIFKRSFTMTLVSVALLGCVYEEYLKIEAITPWPLIIAALLVGIGLDMIFKNVIKKKEPNKVNVNFANVSGHNGNYNGNYTGHIENIQDGEVVKVSYSFGAISKYINSGIFREAKIKNSFGSTNVYFNNAIMKENQASVKVQNAFGETNLYFPKPWRLETKQSASLGNIEFHGMASVNPDSPCVYIDADCSFGCINIYSE